MEEVVRVLREGEVAVRRVTVSPGVGDVFVLGQSGDTTFDRVLRVASMEGAGVVKVTVEERDDRSVTTRTFQLPPLGSDCLRIRGQVNVTATLLTGVACKVSASVVLLGNREGAPSVDARVDLVGAGPATTWSFVSWLPADRHWLTLYAGGALEVAWFDADENLVTSWPVAVAGPSTALVHPPSYALYARNTAVGGTLPLVAAWTS